MVNKGKTDNKILFQWAISEKFAQVVQAGFQGEMPSDKQKNLSSSLASVGFFYCGNENY